MECSSNYSNELYCEFCDYLAKTRQRMDNHLISKKHINTLQELYEVDEDDLTCYECITCNYKTTYKQNYHLHVKTKKHRSNISKDKKFICECGNSYATNKTLSRHKKTCNYIPPKDNQSEQLETDNNNLYGLIKTVMDQNTDLTHQNTELTKQLHSQFNSVVEIAKEPNNVTNNTYNNCTNATSTNNNNNGNSFNIMNYLNTQCAEAENLDDMLHKIKYSLKDIEEMVEIGWLKSTINKLDEIFENLDQTQRPFHCSDAKRKQFYVKLKDEWGKMIGEKVVDLVIFIIQRLQSMTAVQWKQLNADEIDADDELHEKSMCMNAEIGMVSTDKHGKTLKKKVENHLTGFSIDKKKTKAVES
jgi:hypothetical protein